MTEQEQAWFNHGKHLQLAEILQNPTLQQALTMLMMGGIPHGRPTNDTNKEAAEGAWAKGYYDFYFGLHTLASPKALPPPPRVSRELVRDDLPSVMPT